MVPQPEREVQTLRPRSSVPFRTSRHRNVKTLRMAGSVQIFILGLHCFILGLHGGPGIPPLGAGRHEHLDRHGSVHPDLAREAELAQDAIFFETLPLRFSHGGFFRIKLDAAGRTPGLTSAPVAGFLSVRFERENQFGTFFDFKRGAVDGLYDVLAH